jgi:hypothetical protein
MDEYALFVIFVMGIAADVIPLVDKHAMLSDAAQSFSHD